MSDNLFFLQNMVDYHRRNVKYLDNILFLHYCNKGNEYPAYENMDSIYDEYQHHADMELNYQLIIDDFYD